MTTRTTIETGRAAGVERAAERADREAFARTLSEQASAARAGPCAPQVPQTPPAPRTDAAGDWPLVAQPAPKPGAAGGDLRAVFQRGVDETLARTPHAELFRPPPPPVLARPAPSDSPDPAPRGSARPSIWREAPVAAAGGAPVSVPPVSVPPVSAPPGLAALASASAHGSATASVDARAAIETAAARVSGSPGTPAAEGGAPPSPTVAEPAHAAILANVERDAAALPVAAVMRADIERAADQISDQSVAGMVDDVTSRSGVTLDPQQRGEMIAQAREQTKVKMREIAGSLGEPSKDVPKA